MALAVDVEEKEQVRIKVCRKRRGQYLLQEREESKMAWIIIHLEQFSEIAQKRRGPRRENLLSQADSVPSEFRLRNIQSICQPKEKGSDMQSRKDARETEQTVRQRWETGQPQELLQILTASRRPTVWRGWRGNNGGGREFVWVAEAEKTLFVKWDEVKIEVERGNN